MSRNPATAYEPEIDAIVDDILGEVGVNDQMMALDERAFYGKDAFTDLPFPSSGLTFIAGRDQSSFITFVV